MRDLKEYRYATSAAEAVTLLRQGPGKGVFIAGGTDMYLAKPNYDFVVDINDAGLNEIATNENGDLFIGTATPLHSVANDKNIASFADGAICKVAGRCGNRPIRTTATVGGNLCNGLPSADMAPVLMALDTTCFILDEDCQETLPLAEFFIAPRKTVLEGRLLVGLALSAASANWRCLTHKMTRTAEDIALMQMAVSVDIQDDVIEQVRIVLGAVAPVPMRANLAESQLAGKKISEITPDIIADVAEIAAGECDPISDHRASADYRIQMVRVWTRRLVTKILELEK